MAWRPLEHTADVGLEVEAASLDALFADAAAGLCDTITDRARVEPRRHRVTRLAAPALDLLLVEWLDELLFRLDAHGELWCEHETRVVEGRSGRYLLAAISLPWTSWLILALLPIGGVLLSTLAARWTVLRSLGRLL